MSKIKTKSRKGRNFRARKTVVPRQQRLDADMLACLRARDRQVLDCDDDEDLVSRILSTILDDHWVSAPGLDDPEYEAICRGAEKLRELGDASHELVLAHLNTSGPF